MVPVPVLDLVATCDSAYLPHLATMMCSIAASDPDVGIRLWLLHRSIPPADIDSLARFGSFIGMEVRDVLVPADCFGDAKSSSRYPKEMYYRLIAPHLVPGDVERLIYLDPDILVINSLAPLARLELGRNAFAAASHTDAIHPATALNHIRLDNDHMYFNTGVILIDCSAARRLVDPIELFEFASARESKLLFPDQDIFNMLYGDTCLLLDDVVWNFDARKLVDNKIRTLGRASLDWVMDNTVVLHFCGRDKPWHKGYRGPFASLYKHYMRRRDVLAASCGVI